MKVRTSLSIAIGLLASWAVASVVPAQTVLVMPYVQPGNGTELTGKDVKTIMWVTDQTPGEFTVDYGPKDGPMATAKITHIALDFAKPKGWHPAKPAALEPEPLTPKPDAEKPDVEKQTPPGEPDPGKPKGAPDASAETKPAETQPAAAKENEKIGPLVEVEQHYLRYAAELVDLPFDSTITYRVKQGDKVIRESAFKTRTSRNKPVKFIMVGDLADGKAYQNQIAFQIAKSDPDFMVVLGDIVYTYGRVAQYMDHFWRTYDNVTEPGPEHGAPLMASVVFYPVLGNHDVAARLTTFPDAMGAFYFFDVPTNGPGNGAWDPILGTDEKANGAFREKAGPAFPALGFYSFDNGPAHILVLHSSDCVQIGTPKLAEWIENDLKNSKAPWKFVCFHAPAFHTSGQHFTEQKMRLLEPVFEKYGVDVVFCGHVHNYQRTKPLHFAPGNPTKREPRGTVSGKFTLDEKFDGTKNTHPDGVIHIVSGGGGAHLYATNPKTIEVTKKQFKPSWDEFTAKYFSGEHSFSVIELTPEHFHLKAITGSGEVIDEFSIDKPKQE